MKQSPLLAIESGGIENYDLWKKIFSEIAPNIQTTWWEASENSVNQPDYLLVSRPPIGKVAKFQNVKAIICTGAGVDHLVLDPKWPRDVPLVRMGGQRTALLMAEYVLWACLTLYRGARTWARQQEQRIFEREIITCVASEVPVGIMGFGNLGRTVARTLLANNFPVLGWSRHGAPMDGVQVFSGDPQLDDFLGRTRILINLLPNTHETTNKLNSKVLSALPLGAGVVNVGRGNQLVEDDLLTLLNTGHLAGAVLDVFRHEPLPESSPLWGHPKITITPHAASEASRHDHARYIADVIKIFEDGGKPDLLYDWDRGY
ncbi:D-3-phosphoglycerate dehydrogenase [Acetobacter malorum]|uniref:2-hydroxyacid dehydrogenase n=1 Tax=Acetobacter TaxID=434 RepID=UPI0005030BDA|nr:glyoxylate/hydroxypyruvate reductase A [Acetobacter malorum]KFL92452.1 D-3-phosphoglycerate dehydrogenase [Acetobacter malorum]MCG0999482.1 glyoxylate/hydroxypyruvate reductase A [Acetobacter persici]